MKMQVADARLALLAELPDDDQTGCWNDESGPSAPHSATCKN